VSLAISVNFVRKAAMWVKANKHQPVRAQQAHLARMLNGYYQYFGLRLCVAKFEAVRNRIRRFWGQALRRRSQKASDVTIGSA
jgi:hypothetical protein